MDLISQLGVGGIFALLVLQLVFRFLDKRNNIKPISNPPDQDKAKTGDMSVSYWMEQFRELRDGNRDILKEIRALREAIIERLPKV